jgi:hypothetical protein
LIQRSCHPQTAPCRGFHFNGEPEAVRNFGELCEFLAILSIAMIWLAHIGFDRALGYGLKYASGFGFIPQGRIGKLPN